MSAPYFLYVNGKGRPKKPHPDIASARAEARRLFEVATRDTIFIYETVETLLPPEGLPPLLQQPERIVTPAKQAPVVEVKKRRKVVAT
jgi:hypothetical protein